MRKLPLIALLLSILAAVALQCAASEKITLTITPKNAPAGYILQVLGYGSPENAAIVDETGKAHHPTRLKDNSAAEEPTVASLPKGVQSIKLSDTGDSIVLTGESAAVGELAESINNLDVIPRQISVSVRYYEVSEEMAEAIDKLNSSSFDPAARAIETRKLVTKLTSECGLIDAPTISVLENTQAEIKTETQVPYKNPDTDKQEFLAAGSSVKAHVKINKDNTVTTTLTLSSTEVSIGDSVPVSNTHSVYTRRRLASGEPAIVAGFKPSQGKIKVAVVTATIIKDSPEPVSPQQ